MVNCENPVTGVRHWRSVASRRTAYGFGNALLITGQWKYVAVWRGVRSQAIKKSTIALSFLRWIAL